MKVFAYSYRPDEEIYFDTFSRNLCIELMSCKEDISMENADLAKGCECISIITTPVGAELLDKLYAIGVRHVSTRTIGFDHIDIEHAKKIGIHVSHVSYSPHSVADYAIMMILMCLRKIKHIMERASVQDYSLKEIQGRELHNLTVGVVGTGKIGRTLIEHIRGFGCRILANDLHPSSEAAQYAQYVDLDELYQKSDVITLHAPSTEQTFHMIDKEAISKMKNNVVIINTARGTLIDTMDLIEGIESEKIGAVAIDVVENETAIYYTDHKYQIIANRELAILRSFPNVIITPHTAFYTDQAVSDMVENSLKNCAAYYKGERIPFEVV
jgi:D-lactate dehydrogenase